MEKRLKEFRTALNMQQGEFAREMNVLQQQLSKYERGENKPSADFLVKLAQKFGLNLNWLLLGRGAMFLEDCEGEIIKVKAAKGARVLVEFEG